LCSLTEQSATTLFPSFHVLLYSAQDLTRELNDLINTFCGVCFTEIPADLPNTSKRIIYLCGDIHKNYQHVKAANFKRIYVIDKFSFNFDTLDSEVELISLGRVPINLYNAGVYIRSLFGEDEEQSQYFQRIESAHEFRRLTESTKPNFALRTGLYISKVETVHEVISENESVTGLKTWLLRCSSNFGENGPTENFRDIDHHVLDTINEAAANYFEQEIKFNHVLAQIYHNGEKTKAKIKAHSDKTKDMPRCGLIAFCTFYDRQVSAMENIRRSDVDPFDLCYKTTSVLTQLVFRLKNTVEDRTLRKEFCVTLYPNSVFIIPLSTNRLYTHEIKPSVLNPNFLPIRMGYVARCSCTEAIYTDDDRVLVKEEGRSYFELVPITTHQASKLRSLYFEENVTPNVIKYEPTNFSMNLGDHTKPIL